MGLANLLENLKRKKIKEKTLGIQYKAKMNLDQICRKLMCIFLKENVICDSDSFIMTLSKCHVMKVIQAPIILLSF